MVVEKLELLGSLEMSIVIGNVVRDFNTIKKAIVG